VPSFERSKDDETKMTFKRMEAGWRILAKQTTGAVGHQNGNQKRRPIEMAISAGQFLLDSLLRKSSGYKLSAQ
jgi:hypothetical protein